ncbi:DNA mismatch repair endonuclease MutL [bacterium]|nr:DNA mismatch repair endonuclease MutL [bacterium]
MTIQRLAPDVAAKIAAGEVVERPANAAKELIENSVDAGATEIRVEIKEGGQRLLRVVDNGSGIPSDEIALALERHATSKVRQVEDLEHVLTFGFRGEALYSIAAVSHLTLSSRHKDEEFGTQLHAEGGEITGQSRAGLPVGTIVNVEHLFYNVPARKKYLRQPSTEAGHIRSMIQRVALVHPDRRFSLIVDGRMVFQSTGSGEPLEVLAKIYSMDEARQLIAVGKSKAAQFGGAPDDLPAEIDFMDIHPLPDVAPSAVIVSGYISLPTVTRANRSYIDLFVNRRPIEDRTLAHAVVQAYHTFLPVGRYPVAALFIEVPPEHLDVNVHPRKSEVRFLQPRTIYSEVQRVLRRAVVDNANVPGLNLHSGSSSLNSTPQWAGDTWTPRRPFSVAPEEDSPQQALDLYVPPLSTPRRNLDELSARRPAANTWDLPPEAAPDVPPRSEPSSAQPEPAPKETLPAPPSPASRPPSAVTRQLPPLRVVGQAGAMYIIAEGPEGLYLIDQHAAHERIMYEKYMAQRFSGSVPRQGLLDPLTLHVGDMRSGLVAEHLHELNAVGFDIEPFGGDTFLVRAVPSALSEQDAQRVLDDILQGLVDDRNLVGESLEAKLVKMVCKRASIKAGQVLSDIEMKELLRQLEECQSPRTCPHGRPTMIQLTSNELEKAFKRV